jgi:hypothetical protein
MQRSTLIYLSEAKAKKSKEENNKPVGFVDKVKSVASKTGEHLRKNWKKYALGAAVLGTGAAGGYYARNAFADQSKATKMEKDPVKENTPNYSPKATAKDNKISKEIARENTAKGISKAEAPYIKKQAEKHAEKQAEEDAQQYFAKMI